MKLLSFFKYNNVVPISFSLLLLSAGGAFAATNPDAILSAQKTVLTVDNTYIVNKDLSTYTPKVLITGVTEDADSYTVSYTISTIDIDNYIWKDVVKSENMVVAKSDLNGGDLGLYVTKQFKNIISNQIAFLQEVQDKERKNITQETVATAYTGLIGRFLNSSTETLPGYVPIVTPPGGTTTLATLETNPPASISAPVYVTSDPSSPSPAANSGASQVLSLQVLGNNPAQIDVGSNYVDLGVVLIDPSNPNIGYDTFVDGVQELSPIINTAKPRTYTIEYRATDQNGVLVVARRIVLVGAGSDVVQDASSTDTTAPIDSTNSTTTGN